MPVFCPFYASHGPFEYLRGGGPRGGGRRGIHGLSSVDVEFRYRERFILYLQASRGRCTGTPHGKLGSFTAHYGC